MKLIQHQKDGFGFRNGHRMESGELAEIVFILDVVSWFGIDSRIVCAHPPDEQCNYLWN